MSKRSPASSRLPLSSLACGMAGLLASALPAAAGVSGRYIRYEAPVSGRDFVVDIEAYSGGNAIAGQRSIQAWGRQGVAVGEDRMRGYLNGKLTVAEEGKRAPMYDSKGGPTNVCIEVDLHGMHNIDEVKVTRPQHQDGTPRVVTVLDEKRKIVGYAMINLTAENDTELDFYPAADSPHARETIPPGPGGWLPFSEFLPNYTVPEQPGSAKKSAAFAARDTPQNIEKLAKRFFRLMDLRQPHLAEVRAAYEAGKFPEALALYRDLWFKRIADTKNLWGNEIPGAYYEKEADDLLAGKFCVRRAGKNGKSELVIVPYKPGLIPWGFIPADNMKDAFIGWNRACAGANRFGRSLLTAYRETGDARYLNRWEEVTDDFSMNFIQAADASPVDLRDYFVKEPLQFWNFFVFELAETARRQPKFVSQFPPGTLARILMLAQEEYAPPYWRVARKCVFNHTFNALNAAYSAVDSFRDFTAGERLMRETLDHFERVTSYNTTRDGSMAEIGDDGHISMHMRLGISLYDIFARHPDWIDPMLVRQLKDRFAEMTRFQVRHLTANGLTHRGYMDGFQQAFLSDPKDRQRGGWVAPLEMYEDTSVYRSPEIRAVLEAAFGDQPDHAARLREFYGNGTFTATPRVVSDFMPYAGLYYLRNRWGGNHSSAHMMSPPTDHPSSNQVDQTSFFLAGKGVPMFHFGSVSLDRDTPNPDLGKPLFRPGSKTARLTESAPDPLDVRWYSGRDFDLAEASWRGPYAGKGEEDEGAGSIYGTVETRRFLIQYRPADLWIAADRIATGREASKAPRNYHITAGLTVPNGEAPTTDAAPNALDLPPGDYAGMESRFFANSPVTVSSAQGGKRKQPQKVATGGGFRIRSTRFPKDLRWTHAAFELTAPGGRTFAGLGLIHPRLHDDPVIAANAKAVPGLGHDEAGFKAPLPGGGEIAAFVASGGTPGKFSEGPLSAQASLLVVVNDSKGTRGLVLDAASFAIGGKAPAPAAVRDFAFETSPGGVKITPILRPLRLPVISPGTPVFIGKTTITLSAPDKGARVYYTLDGSDPVPGAKGTLLYTAPFPLDQSTLVKARTVRGELPPGSFTPFRVDGTLYSEIQYAAFEKKEPLPAAAVNGAALHSGLKMEFLHDTWMRLFSFLDNPAETPAEKTLNVQNVLNPADFAPLRKDDRYFGVRYSGYLDVPAEGVYTFHPPVELTHDRSTVPGYDLQVSIDGVAWNPDFTWQGGGNWAVALAKGPHRLQIAYADVRTRDKTCPSTGLWRGFPSDHVVWKGDAPVLKISGPGIDPEPIPANWLRLQ